MITWCVRELSRITEIFADHGKIEVLTETELSQAHKDADQLVSSLNAEMTRRLRKLRRRGGSVKT
jgi:hypothetical protein